MNCLQFISASKPTTGTCKTYTRDAVVVGGPLSQALRASLHTRDPLLHKGSLPASIFTHGRLLYKGFAPVFCGRALDRAFRDPSLSNGIYRATGILTLRYVVLVVFLRRFGRKVSVVVTLILAAASSVCAVLLTMYGGSGKGEKWNSQNILRLLTIPQTPRNSSWH